MSKSLALAALLALLVSACGDLDGPQKSSRVGGDVILVTRAGIAAEPDARQGFPCFGRGAYADVVPGAPVVVEDASGRDVTAGRLGRGRLMIDLFEIERGGSAAGVTQGCQIGFTVNDVPPIGTRWSVRIGTHRFDLAPENPTNQRLILG